MGSRFRLPAILLLLALLVASGVRAETLLERGTYLVRSIVGCGNCHTPKGPSGEELSGMELAGGFLIRDPAFDARTSNLTPDRETGIGGWTDAQLIDAIRNGRRPDGTLIGPPMPFHFYRGISDGDVRAIVAYVRSVPAVRNAVVPSAYRMPLPPAWGPDVVSVPEVPRDDPVRYGEYLVGPLGHCLECHTPMEEGRFQYDTKRGAGGFQFHLPFGTTVSANITSDPETGIGAWRDDEIERAITRGVGRDGGALLPPMPYPYYANISPADLGAIVAYLRTLAPVHQVRAARLLPAKP